MSPLEYDIKYVNPAIQKMAVTTRNPSPDPIDEDMIEYFTQLACQTPSKQSQCCFDLYVITDMDFIKNKIYPATAVPDPEPNVLHPQPYNPQVLAPLLLLYSRKIMPQKQRYMNNSSDYLQEFMRDGCVAMGISMGVVAYEASRIGFRTGYCACVDNDLLQACIQEKIGKEIEMNNLHILCISKDLGLDPREHAVHGKECYFNPQEKNFIEVTRIR